MDGTQQILWERKAGLVKSINDNKIDVMGPLIGALLESLHFLFSPKKKFSSFSFQSLSKLSTPKTSILEFLTTASIRGGRG